MITVDPSALWSRYLSFLRDHGHAVRDVETSVAARRLFETLLSTSPLCGKEASPAPAKRRTAVSEVGTMPIGQIVARLSTKPYDEQTESERRFGNLAAFVTLRRLADSPDRLATVEERQALRAWSGWGGIDFSKIPRDPAILTEEYLTAFDTWDAMREGDREVATEDMTASAGLLQGVLNQFFTPMWIVRSMWSLASRAMPARGYARALEPSAGSGRFVEGAPEDYEGTAWTLVEWDKLGSAALRHLYGDRQGVHIYGDIPFEAYAAPASASHASFDLIIGNPPYPERLTSTLNLDIDFGRYMRAHAYFVARSASLLAPGGVMVMLTPLGQIHAQEGTRGLPEMRDLRRYLARTCQLRGAYALPADAFPGARLNLVVHVWEKRGAFDVSLPETVGGIPTADFIAGQWFHSPAGQTSVLGAWVKDSRYRDSMVVAGPRDEARLSAMPLLPGLAGEALAAAEQDYRENFENLPTTAWDVVPVTALSEAQATRTRRRAMEQAHADADIRPYILARAHNLSARVAQWATWTHTDPNLAADARVELSADISDLLSAVPHTDPLFQDEQLTPLVSVFTESGELIPKLLATANARVLRADYRTVREVIDGYCERFGACEETDIVRHGFTLSDAQRESLLGDEVCLDPLETGNGYHYLLAGTYYSGELWPRFDRATAVLSVLPTDDVLYPKFTAQRERLYATIQPRTLADIQPTPRSPFIPAQVLSAFAEHFCYDWTPQPDTNTDVSGRHAKLPGILILVQNGQYKIVPRRRQRSNLGERFRERERDYKRGIEHRAAQPEKYLEAVTSEVLPPGSWDTDDWNISVIQHYSLADSAEFPNNSGVRIAWRDTDLETAWTDDFSRDVPFTGEDGLLPFTRPTGLKNAYRWSRWGEDYAPRRKEGERSSRPLDFYEIVEDRAVALMGYLNQEKQVAPFPGTGRTTKRSVAAIAGKPEQEERITEATIASAFERWLSAEEAYGDLVEKTYNRRFCGRVPATVVTKQLNLPRRTDSVVALRPFQIIAAARAALQESLLLSLDVGLGKTFTSLTATAIRRAEGKARRCAVVAPNSVSPNWLKEAAALLPDYIVEMVGFHAIKRGTGVEWAPDSAAERVAKWEAFRLGLIDILVIPYSKFREDAALSDDETFTALKQLAVAQKLAANNKEKIAVAQEKLSDAEALFLVGAGMKLQEESSETLQRLLQSRDFEQLAKLTRAHTGLSSQLVEIQGIITDLEALAKPDGNMTNKGIYASLSNLDWVRALQPFRVRRKYVAWSPKDSLADLVQTATEIGLDLPPIDELPPKEQRLAVIATLQAGGPKAEGETIVVEPLILWDTLGVDHLVIDEAHNFKNLFAPIATTDVAFLGAPTGNTGQAWDMWLKCQYLNNNNMDKGVFLLTATPLKNSPLELFNLLSLLSQHLWRTLGVVTPDLFIDRYLEIDPAAITVDVSGGITIRPALKNFKDSTIGELRRLVASIEQLLTSDDLRADYEARGELIAYNKLFPTSNLIEAQVPTDDVQESILQPLRDFLDAEHSIDVGAGVILDVATRRSQRAERMKEREENGELSPVEQALWEIEQESPGDASLMILDIATKASLDPRLLSNSYKEAVKRLPTVKARHAEARKAAIAAGYENLVKEIEDVKKKKKEAEDDDEDALSQRNKKLMYPGPVRVFMRTRRAFISTSRQIEVLGAVDVESWTALYKSQNLEAPKVEKVADIIGAKPKFGFVVFCDYKDTHSAVKRALIRRGMAKERVMIMAGDPPTRQIIAEAFNRGEYDVIIGTTKIMGEGVNLQTRTEGIVHMDFPWEPASMRQREGRAVRQGNTVGHVKVIRLVTPGSADLLRLNAIAGKKGWQDRFRNTEVAAVDMDGLVRGPPSRDDLLISLVYYKMTPEHIERRAILTKYITEIKKAYEAEQRMNKIYQIVNRLTFVFDQFQTRARQLAADETRRKNLKRDAETSLALLASLQVPEEPRVTIQRALDTGGIVRVSLDAQGNVQVLEDGQWVYLRNVEPAAPEYTGYVEGVDERDPRIVRPIFPSDPAWASLSADRRSAAGLIATTSTALYKATLGGSGVVLRRYGRPNVKDTTTDRAAVRIWMRDRNVTITADLLKAEGLWGAFWDLDAINAGDQAALVKSLPVAQWPLIQPELWGMKAFNQRWFHHYGLNGGALIAESSQTRLEQLVLPVLTPKGEIVLWPLGLIQFGRLAHDENFAGRNQDSDRTLAPFLRAAGLWGMVDIEAATRNTLYNGRYTYYNIRYVETLQRLFPAEGWSEAWETLLASTLVPPTSDGLVFLREAFLADQVRVAVWGGPPERSGWDGMDTSLKIIYIPNEVLKTSRRRLEPSDRDVMQSWQALLQVGRWFRNYGISGTPWYPEVGQDGKGAEVKRFVRPNSWPDGSIILNTQADALRRSRGGDVEAEVVDAEENLNDIIVA